MDARSLSLSPGAVSAGWEAADAFSVGSSHSLLSVASLLKNEIPANVAMILGRPKA